MKALVGAFNQEKALVGAFSVIVQPVVEPMERYRQESCAPSSSLAPAPHTLLVFRPGYSEATQGFDGGDAEVLCLSSI